LPGIPSLYYGDEAGLTGGADPFCRGCYPWGNVDKELLHFYAKLGEMRKNSNAFKGDLRCIHAGLGLLCYEREYENEKILTHFRRSYRETYSNT
jgi:glycosidase